MRALSAASLVLLVPVLYFTFGRGGWLALAAGIAAAIVIDPRRLQLATTLLVVAPWPALAVWRAYESPSSDHAVLSARGRVARGQPTRVDDCPPRGRLRRRHRGLHAPCSPSHRRTSCPACLRNCTRPCPRELCRCRDRRLRRPFRVSPTCARLDQAGLADRKRGSDEPPVQPLVEWPARYVGVGSRRLSGACRARLRRGDVRAVVARGSERRAQGSRRTQSVPRDPRGAGAIRSCRAPRADRRTAHRRGSRAPQPVRRSGARRLRRTGRPRGGRLGLGGAGGDDRWAHVRRSSPAGRRGSSTESVDTRWLDAGRADRVHRALLRCSRSPP